MIRSRSLLGAAIGLAIGGPPAFAAPSPAGADLALLNRVSWGISVSSGAELERVGADRWLQGQLHPAPGDHLPPAAEAQIKALTIAREPMAQLVRDADAANRFGGGLPTLGQRNTAQSLYQQGMNELARQAAMRSLLRDLYSEDQLKEQMTWFWMNHFNVQQSKGAIRAMVGDYEETAIRPRALGHFRELLEATLRHPAMLRYLDNADNAAGHLNENYARELMELHTMGVGSGYTQQDVQELARILTGVGIDLSPADPKLAPQHAADLVHVGLFEFNPNRHDYGDKVFLGHVIKGRGFGEVEEALDILCREPATARHVSLELAQYFVSDNPPPELVDAMAASFQRSNGDIAQVLETMFQSRAFRASFGTKFKDPIHYAVSAVRLAYDDKLILNTGPIQAWLNQLAEGLYAHETPDGYAMMASGWNGPGQLSQRFEIAHQIGGGSAGLFKAQAPGAPDPPAFPQLQNALYFNQIAPTLSPSTASALDKAASPEDWNALFLASPEFMRR
jgi:uncharacterized protein (DUF1800 family)